jgi:hypothetical protein
MPDISCLSKVPTTQIFESLLGEVREVYHTRDIPRSLPCSLARSNRQTAV